MTTATLTTPSTKVFRTKLLSSKTANINTGACGCSHSWTFQRADNENNESMEDRILIAKQVWEGHCDHCDIWPGSHHMKFRGYYHENTMAISAHYWDNDELARLESMVIRAFKAEGLEIIYSNWA